MVLIVVTGAAGFIGRAVARGLGDRGLADRVRLVDRIAPDPHGGFYTLTTDLAHSAGLAAALDGATHVIHLAALPGGAAERDPAASRAVNLTTSLDLIDRLAERPTPARLVYASSIAALGGKLPDTVDDATPPRPDTTYGAHKHMVEIALADATRRGGVEGIALRLPGIVARPGGDTGFRSAFMSEVFHALANGVPYTLPVGPDATMWLLSARACADALIHAALADASTPVIGTVTLPALRVRMADLVAVIARATGGNAARLIAYDPDPAIEAIFGALPPLTTARADALGFRHDGDLARLVENALRGAA